MRIACFHGAESGLAERIELSHFRSKCECSAIVRYAGGRADCVQMDLFILWYRHKLPACFPDRCDTLQTGLVHDTSFAT